jgi:hypothetical protein
MQLDVLQARQETIMTVVAYKCVYIMGNIYGLGPDNTERSTN